MSLLYKPVLGKDYVQNQALNLSKVSKKHEGVLVLL